MCSRAWPKGDPTHWLKLFSANIPKVWHDFRLVSSTGLDAISGAVVPAIKVCTVPAAAVVVRQLHMT